jgi:hypothetical protein
MEEDTLNTMYNTLTIKKKGEVFRRLLDSKEFYDNIYRGFNKDIKDQFIEHLFSTDDLEELITQFPISNDDVKIIHDEFIKAIEYVNSPHTPPVRSRVGTPVGSNNENENETENESENESNSNSNAMSYRKSRKAKSRKAKSRKAKARKATRRK